MGEDFMDHDEEEDDDDDGDRDDPVDQDESRKIPVVESYTKQLTRADSVSDYRTALALRLSLDLLTLMIQNLVLFAGMIDQVRLTDPSKADEMESRVRTMQGRIDSMMAVLEENPDVFSN